MRVKAFGIKIRCGTFVGLAAGLSMAQTPLNPPDTPDFGLHPGYSVMTLRPDSWQPQVAGLELMPNGDLLVLTWRGATGPAGDVTLNGVTIPGTVNRTGTGKIFRVTGTQGTDRSAIRFTEIATGLKDAHGLTVVNGEIYVGDLDRVVKLVDADGNGVYEGKQEIGKFPAYNGWFEYAFGPVHKDGRLYMGLAVAVLHGGNWVRQLGPDRGTVISMPITGGAYQVEVDGLRAPAGLALGPSGDLFVTDNQGGWKPSGQIIHVVPGRFYGYRNEPAGKFQNQPVTPPSIWAPYKETNDSPTEPVLMTAGPYAGQLVYGDIGRGGFYRAFLEKVKGEYQGAIFAMSGGFEVGTYRLRTNSKGEIFTGGLGIGSHHGQGWNYTRFGLQKLIPNGKSVFEMLAVRAKTKGLEIEFTTPVSDAASTLSQYQVQQWGYTPTQAYGGPKIGTQLKTVTAARISADGRKVYLEITGLKTGQVTLIKLNGLKSRAGENPWYPTTWYTLNAIPDTDTPTALVEEGPAWSATDIRAARDRSGNLVVELPERGRFRVEVRDLRGMVASEGEARQRLVLQASHFRPGIYLVRVATATRRATLKVAF